MDWLNYHHLLYFYTVAKEGSVSRAATVLRLAQPTLSGQIRKLEEAFDEKLFARAGRHLVLTEMGRVVYRYADEIFGIGRELTETLRGRSSGRPREAHDRHRRRRAQADHASAARDRARAARTRAARLSRGQDGAAARRPRAARARSRDHATRRCRRTSSVQAYNHPLGECTITFFATPRARAGARQALPALARRRADAAADREHVAAALARPVVPELRRAPAHRRRVRGQRAAQGVRPARPRHLPGAVDPRARRSARTTACTRSARAETVVERFYAISVERRIKHQAVAAITGAARERIFRNRKSRD